MIGVGGDQEGVEFDPVPGSAGKTWVWVFQDGTVVGLRGLLVFSRILDRISAQHPSTGLTAVLLDDDTEQAMTVAKRVAGRLPDLAQITVSADGRDGPGTLGLDRNVAQTILVVKDGKVRFSFALRQPMGYPDPHVLGTIAEVLDVPARELESQLNEVPNGQQMMRRK